MIKKNFISLKKKWLYECAKSIWFISLKKKNNSYKSIKKLEKKKGYTSVTTRMGDI